MIFLNDISIKKEGLTEDEVIKLCKENDIKIGDAWYGTKWLGRIISDEDHDHLFWIIREYKHNRN